MKRIIMKQFFLTLVTFVAIATAWGQARIPVNDPPPGGNTKPTVNPTPTNTGNSELVKYADPGGKFTIGYPSDWKFNNKPENAVIQITSPKEKDDDAFYQNVNLQMEDAKSSLTIEEYVKTNMDAVKELIKNYREVSSMYFNRNGSRAYQIVYKGKYGSATYEMQIKQLFVVANGKAFILTYVAKEDERDAFETTANKIFNSFKY